LVLLWATLALGGVHPAYLAPAHAALGATLLWGSVSLPSRSVAGLPLGRWLVASTLLWGVQLVSVAWSLHREATVGAVADSLLWAGCGALAVLAAAAARRSSELHWPWTVAIGGVAALAALHVYAGASSVLGVLHPRTPPVRFWAPFVNPNHFGCLLVLGFPVALGGAFGRGGWARRWCSGAAAVCLGGAGVASGSALALLVMGLQAVLLGALFWRPLLLVGAASVPFALPAALRWASSHGGSATASIDGRLEMWAATARLLWDYPLLGVGAGAYAAAVGPYRERVLFASWAHAHSDPLEWVVETGILGCLALLLAFATLKPWSLPSSPFLSRLLVGCTGLAVFSLADFPLHIPALTMWAAVAVGWWLGRREHRAVGSTTVARAGLVVLAVGQFLAGGWQLRTAAVDRAAAQLAGDPGDAFAARVLTMGAPWRPDGELARVRAALMAGAPGQEEALLAMVSAHPDDDRVLRFCAGSLLRLDRAEEALPIADRLVDLTPWDRRAWKLRALVHMRADPGNAYGAWGDAVRAGVPGALEAGWSLLPVGVYWVDALADAPMAIRASLGAFLLRQGEGEAAALAWEAVALDAPGMPLRELPGLWVSMGQAERACDYMVALSDAAPDDRWVRRELPVVLEACGRFDEARDAWLVNWGSGGFGLGEAVRCEAKAESLASAQALWVAKTSLGRPSTSRDRLGLAQMYLENGRRRDCLEQLSLAESRTLSKGSSARKKQLRHACEALP